MTYDIQTEILSKQLNIEVWTSVEGSELENKIQSHWHMDDILKAIRLTLAFI
jgi:hypothetical protein